MPIEKKAGAVVYALHEGQYYLAMLHDVFGFWTLSKSGMKGDETAEQAAMRAIKEEMNLDIRIVEKLGEYEYIANHPEKGKIRKQVHYFLGEAQYTPLTLGKSGGLDDVQWFPITDVTELRMYENITQLIIQSAGILLGDTVNTDTNSEINSDTSANTDINSDTTTIDSSTK
jgi:ADP-ribose pyrophosphatase YjhB (NUDIX family)